jgi:hypothetical protein
MKLKEYIETVGYDLERRREIIKYKKKAGGRLRFTPNKKNQIKLNFMSVTFKIPRAQWKNLLFWSRSRGCSPDEAIQLFLSDIEFKNRAEEIFLIKTENLMLKRQVEAWKREAEGFGKPKKLKGC